MLYDRLWTASESAATPTARPSPAPAAIVAAALELFAARGYHGTAVPDVAKRAGVGTGTIYRHFSHKEALVNAVFQHAKAALRAALYDDLDMRLAPRALFAAFWDRLSRFALDEPTAFAFLELQDHVPYLDEESQALEAQVLAPLFLTVLELQRRGVVRRMHTGAIMAQVWGGFVGLFKAARLGYLHLDETMLAEARDACWDAFAVPSSATPSAVSTATEPSTNPARKEPDHG